MKLRTILLLLIALSTVNFAQSGKIVGKIVDKETNESISEVHILVANTGQGVVSDGKGLFAINDLERKKYELKFSHVGYEVLNLEIELNSSSKYIELKMIPTSVNVGEVVVSSAKYKKTIKDVPYPMEVMSSQNIEKTTAITTADLIASKPGISLQRDGVWGTTVTLRGLSKNSIVTLVDGNRIETATNISAGLSMIDVNDIDRIEVIKGAASSLYGSGAMGGVVNVITKDGNYSENTRIGGAFWSGYNSVNKGATGSLNLNSGGNNWYLKVASTFRSADDAETPNGILNNSQFRDNSVSVRAGLKTFANHEIKVNYQRFEAKDVGIPGGEPFGPLAIATYPEEKRDLYSASYSISNISSKLVNVEMKYYHQKIHRSVEMIPQPGRIVTPKADHYTDGVQLHSNWIFGKNQLVVGADIWQREYNGLRKINNISKKTILVDKALPDSKFKSAGLFAQDEIELVPKKFKVTLGGRFDLIKIENEASYNPEYIIVDGNRIDNPPTKKLLWKKNEEDDFSWSANIGLIYSMTKELDFSINLAKSFRAPSLEERFEHINLMTKTYWGNPELDHEKGSFVDLGIRYWGHDLFVNASVFANWLNDLVSDEKIDDNTYRKVNVGKARLYGFDFSTEYRVFRENVIYASAAYVRGEDTGNDTDLPQIASLNGRFGIRSTINNMVEIDLCSAFFAEQNKVAKGENETPGYGTMNISVAGKPIDLGTMKIKLALGAENIFDKAYRNHLSTYRGITHLEPGRNIFFKVGLVW